MEIGYGGNALAAQCAGGKIMQPTIEERLINKKQRLESELKDTNAALEALQANPEILKVLSLISKVCY